MFQKREITGALIILTMVFVLSLPTLALADTIPTVDRLAGYDRYETAAKIAKNGWTVSDYVVLAYGENYPDALAATPLASKYDAPILLTTSNILPDTTKQTLRDLKVKNVIIVGGTGVIFTSVEAELQAMNLQVTRVYGYDKYETAVEIARQLDSPSELFVVTGEDFADALSVAPIAGIKQMPIILVPKDTVPDSVINYISTLKVNKSYVVGDPELNISDQVCDQFPNAERIRGVDPYRKNHIINLEFIDVFKSNRICIATGEIFADALTGTAYAAKLSAPIILINNNPSKLTKDYCGSMASKSGYIFVFGGTGIIPDKVLNDLTIDNLKPREKVDIDVDAFAAEVLRLINIEREKEGLSALSGSNTALNQAAAQRAVETLTLDSDKRPNGEDWFTVLPEFGVNSFSAGEILIYGSVTAATPERVVELCMDSGENQEEVFRPEYTQLGVGIAVDDQGNVSCIPLFIAN